MPLPPESLDDTKGANAPGRFRLILGQCEDLGGKPVLSNGETVGAPVFTEAVTARQIKQNLYHSKQEGR